MIQVLIIGAGGFIGAIARYGLSGLIQRHVGSSFPFGTLFVNVLGCFIIGVVMCLVETRQAIGPNARLFTTIGLLGSLTTFSTFGYETLALLKGNEFGIALGNIALNVIVGIGAVILGWMLIKLSGI